MRGSNKAFVETRQPGSKIKSWEGTYNSIMFLFGGRMVSLRLLTRLCVILILPSSLPGLALATDRWAPVLRLQALVKTSLVLVDVAGQRA